MDSRHEKIEIRSTSNVFTVCLLAFATFAARADEAPHSPKWRDKIDPSVWQFAEGSSTGETDFIVFLSEQADVRAAARLETKLEKGIYVFQKLTDVAQRSQSALLSSLDLQGIKYQSFWIANMVLVHGNPTVIQKMAQRADVARIYANPKVHFQPPLSDLEAEPHTILTIEPGINWIHAPSVWALGFTGQGIIVGGSDTGYRWTHQALRGQYRGENGTANHNYNWHDSIHSGGGVCGSNSPAPCDDDGHGSHTMGTIVGTDGGSNQVGVAPGAKWIGCRSMDQGNGTPATYSECLEFFVAPTDLNGANPDPSKAPDVVNSSWACPTSQGCGPLTLQVPLENMRAAGIIPIASAGSSGSACSTVQEPPAIYAASIAVGASGNNSNAIASFSSRGPVTVDGSNRQKPNVTAPGISIRSSYAGGDTSYQSLSGTSMSAPHVTGTVALILSAHPELRGNVDAIQMVLEQSAVHLTSTQTCGGTSGGMIPNNTFGWGRIDALAAVTSVATPTPVPTQTPTPIPTSTPSPAPTPLPITVSLPTDTFDISIPVTVVLEPVVVTDINPTTDGGAKFASFQGDFSFDSDVVGLTTPSVQPAGLTASNWEVTATILNPGPARIKTLHISASSLDSTPLNGSGTLFNLRMFRGSSTGAGTVLTWASTPGNFLFIDDNANPHVPNQTNGLITIVTPPICDASEGFDNIAGLVPAGWFMQNNSQPGPGTTSWFEGVTAFFPSHSGADISYLAANYDNGTGTSTLSNWLLTPQLTLQNGSQLSLWTRTVDSPAYADRLQVRMSTNGGSSNVGSTATSVGDFTTLLLDINPSYTLAGYPSAWTQFAVTLSGLGSPTTGRLAFRYFVENGGPGGTNSDYIGIDSLQYTCNAATPTPTPTPINISGIVSYCSNPIPGPVPNVTLSLTGGASSSTQSNASGNYLFSLAPGGTCTVTPTKPALLSGSTANINTVDVIATQRHFTSCASRPETCLSGCRLTAADANGDGNVTTIDVIAIQRFSLGITTGTANVGKYKFIPASRTYSGVTSNQSGQNYDTLIFGDVASHFAE